MRSLFTCPAGADSEPRRPLKIEKETKGEQARIITRAEVTELLKVSDCLISLSQPNPQQWPVKG